MAVITLDYANTLKEAPANDGTVEGSVVITLTESTFAGTNGQALPGVTFGNVPPGLTAVLVRTNDNTATLTFTGKATTHKADITNLTVTLTAASFDSGADINGVNLVKDNLLIDFDEAPTGGGSEPHVAFSGPLLITSVEDTTGDNVGKLEKVTLTGYAATPGVELTLFNGTKKLEDEVTVNPNGTWTASFTPAKAGVYNLSVKETFIDKSGTKDKTLYGGPSNTVTYTADDKAPPAPKVDKFKLPTADTTPTITGKAEKFAEVEVFAKLGEGADTSLGKVQANDKGIWSLQVENALAEGTYALTAKATDAAGNTSATASKAETLTIDTSVAAFSITADKGLKYSDDAKFWATKKFSSQKLEGKAEANSVIHFFGGPDGTVPLGKPVKVNKSGDWKATLKLTDGAHVISAVIIDQAGNISDSQSVGTIKVDSFAPIVTVKKEDKTPTKLSGLVEHDAVEVTVFAGKEKLGTVTTGLENGTWELDVTGKDIKGKQKITVTAKDAAGNVSKPSAGVTYDFTEAAGDGGGGTFEVTESAPGSKIWTLSTKNGNVVVTDDGANYVFTPASGTAVSKAKTDVTEVVVSTITLSGAASVLKDITKITGAVTVSDANADAALLNGILGATSGVVTAALTGSADSLNTALTNGHADDLLTISLTAQPTDIANINGLNAKTALPVDASLVTTITSAATTTIDLTAAGVTWKSGINVTGTAGNDTITGGAGNDTITGGAGADVLTGGEGVNTFIFAGGDAEVATYDTITDLVLGTDGDILQLGGTNAAAAANIKTLAPALQDLVTGSATLAAAVGQVASFTSGAKIATTFTYGTDTFIFYNVADDDAFTAETDMLIKITGVTGTLDVSNITIA